MTALKVIASLALLGAVSGCTNFYEIPVETPLEPKLDTSGFQRILIAGFVVGGTDDVDANLETARLLRSQLRTNSDLEVIDAEVIELLAVAEEQSDFVPPRGAEREGSVSDDPDPPLDDPEDPDAEAEEAQLSEEDLEAYEQIFSDAGYWRQLGEEYQNPLIVTGTIHFAPYERAGMVSREREVYDSFGRRRVVPTRTYQERRGYVLSPKFIFIDGGTGATLHTERHREEILYDARQNTPALSSYFELMDRLLPSFLGTAEQRKHPRHENSAQIAFLSRALQRTCCSSTLTVCVRRDLTRSGG